MKRFVKVISLLLSVVLLFSSCSGVNLDEEESTTVPAVTEKSPTVSDGVVTLPFNPTDSINPFFAKSYENLYLCELIYESLYEIDSEYNVFGEIATSVVVNENIARVTLSSGYSFSDLTAVKAQDVAYSFNLAKNSYAWADCLSTILSATVISDYVIDFELAFKDIYVAGKLDFPIVKYGTADEQTNTPIGSGDYVFKEDKLVHEMNFSKEILLYEIDTNESSENAFKIGETDVYFSDLSDCSFSAITGNTESVLLNNMVYIGVNSKNGALNRYVRSAIVAKLNCDDIAVSSYQGHAFATKIPVNPESKLISEILTVDSKGNMEIANGILDRSGYTRWYGKVKTDGVYPLSMTLIVNEDNNYRVATAYSIAQSLEECGFGITVEALPFDEYEQRIVAGNYDLYLGEIVLDGTFDLSAFFMSDSVLGKNINQTESASVEYFRYRAGEITASEYYKAFVEDYPFIPICFRKGYVVNSADVNLKLLEMPFDLYSGL